VVHELNKIPGVQFSQYMTRLAAIAARWVRPILVGAVE